MNYTELTYINLISDCLNGRSARDIDFENLDEALFVALCKAHSNVTVIYSAMKDANGIPDSFMDVMKQGFMTFVMRYSKKNNFASLVSQKMDDNSIKHLIFKGPSIAQDYPAAELRTMGDIDFLINQEDYSKAKQLMEEMGAELDESQTDSKVLFYKLNDNSIEIHTSLAHDQNMSGKVDYDEYFNDAFEHMIDVDDRHYLEAQYQFIYVLYHMAQHFYYAGCGVRMVTDVAVIIDKHSDEFDWEYIAGELEKLGLSDFSKAVFTLCDKWFGIKANTDYSIDDELAEEFGKYVLYSGLFGRENFDKDVSQMKKNDQYTKSKKGSTIRWAFPPYKYMRESSPWFKNKPAILLPVAYVERFMRNARKRGGAVEWGQKMARNQTKLKNHEEMIEKLGLS